MWNRKLATLILVAALLSAGCVSDNPGGVTTAETTTDGPNTTTFDREYPPGVTADGIENASALLQAHAASVTETGYEYKYRENASQTGDGDDFVSVERGAVAAGGTAFERIIEIEQAKSRYTAALWVNESVMLSRTTNGDGTQYNKRYRNDERDSSRPVEQLFRLRRALEHGAFDIADTTTDGDATYVTLTATEYVGDESRNVTAFDARLVVDRTGRIHELDIDLSYVDRNGAVMRERHRYELTTQAVTTVQQPSWANEALSAVDTSIRVDTEDNRLITVTHRGGDTLSAGSAVTVEHDGETHVLELESALKTGSVVYVYFPTNADAPVLVRERPSEDVNAEEFDGEYAVSVTDADGNRVAGVGFAVESASASESSTEPTPTPTPDE